MAERTGRVRLRQAVLVAEQLEPTAEALRTALALEEPFRDPGVGEFGLANTVFALGDCFLEVVSPTRPDTAAGRYLARHGGEGGDLGSFDPQGPLPEPGRAASPGGGARWPVE